MTQNRLTARQTQNLFEAVTGQLELLPAEKRVAIVDQMIAAAKADSPTLPILRQLRAAL